MEVSARTSKPAYVRMRVCMRACVREAASGGEALSPECVLKSGN